MLKRCFCRPLAPTAVSPRPGERFYRLVAFGIQAAEQAGILHNNRQHPGQRPEADGAHKNQPPDSHIDPAQDVKQPTHQQGDNPRNQAAHNIARREEGEQQGDNRGGERPDEDDRQGNPDLREIVAGTAS
ncbi:Uncharacterised protein [Raoultella terrigena]|uniref:Uncharacterized protein n=1 Tax=Raoultella terrigena TaxID=577 RepID=A0A4U9DDE2_RAOTE|nr:Uncharacterised protein [Raoultella terrigena]